MEKKPKFIRVESVKHLADLTKDRTGDFRMLLNGGVFSRKYITYNPRKKMFHIENCIDGSTQWLGTPGLMDEKKTLIGKAITCGALLLEEVLG